MLIACRQARFAWGAQQEKNHVYIFLINGLDPLYLANLNGLCAYLKALGFAQAEVGQFTEAVATARKALDLAARAGQERQAQQYEAMLESFKSGKPWRANQ